MTGAQSIDRAAQLLVLVVEGDGATSVGELAQRSGLPKSTVSRAVSALERRGLLQRDGARRGVRPGPVLLGLARRGVPDADLVALAAPILEALGEASGETINLAVPTPLGVEHLAQVDSRHFIGSTNWLGRRVEYSTTGVGKVFAAFAAAPAELDHGVSEAVIETVRARGYATAVGELEPGLAAMAAPVRDAGGRTVAALSISGPDHRLTTARIAELAPVLVAGADGLSARLGFQATTQGAA
ncbi:MAG TPA: IclR family transcriptional regulator [Gaiellales bacterium]|nr:IclR family transcriptional regulator [Gaiellales bacterium]